MIQRLTDDPSFTSYMEAKKTQKASGDCEIPADALEGNPDFFNSLDENGVVEIGSDYFRFDYCNDKVWVISVAAGGGNETNYNDFLEGDTTNSNVGWFFAFVDVLEAVAENYRTMPDTTQINDTAEVFKLGAFGDVWNEWKYFYDEDDPNSIPGNTRMDGKLAYDRFGLWFHLYGKEKYQRVTFLGWTTVSYGTHDWSVKYEYKYIRKGQSTEHTGSGTMYPPGSGENKVEHDVYEGGRGLKKFHLRWNVPNYTHYHNIDRKENGFPTTYHYGQYVQGSPSNIHNFEFTQNYTYGNPNYYQIIYGY
jgi:hypothetical protein